MKPPKEHGVTGSLESIARGVRLGELDPVELAERAIHRAQQVSGLGAVVHIDVDGARQAAQAVAGTRTGPLAGVPLLVKEIIEVRGLPHRCGSRVFADRVGTSDAAVVRRARNAGAVIIGLSHSHEFAYGCTGTSNRIGPCRNPHDPSRMAGGSSAGSAAAVAAGVVPLALGSDTAGSVRIPAALCGVVGAKPARGTLPLDGVFPLSPSLDHVGVLTASVADARLATEVLGGVDLSTWSLPGAPTLGIPANPEPLDCSTTVGDAYSASIDRLAAAGASIVEIPLPRWPEMTATALDLQGPEANRVHAGRMADHAEDYQSDVLERLRAGAGISARRHERARHHAAELAATVDQLLRTVDAIVLPTVPVVAPPLEAKDVGEAGQRLPVREVLLRNTRPANLTGHPALSLPVPAASRLPVGLQLIAAENAHAFAVAEWVEQVINDERGAST
ncbi:amidase [Streptomyces sp. NPDC050988]|uniref:amidase n=1 Tax=Streptomyces sp. NPDC050988 TaxID=3365637 RepID=UPI0037AC1CC7